MPALKDIPRTPAFVLEYGAFRKNLKLIESLQREAPCSFLFALKGFAMHRVFPDIVRIVRGAAASSLYETRLAAEFFPEVHAYAPAYIPRDFAEIAEHAAHITFNSISEFQRCSSSAGKAKAGLRINPEFSAVETDLYNPCAPGSRLGVHASELKSLPQGITGLHSHNLCEGSAEQLEQTVDQIEARYGHLLNSITWLNLGGGHLVTHRSYDTELFIKVIRQFHRRHPHIDIILEPGAAFVWETGVLTAQVLDLVTSGGITTAVLDTSFAAHMPDCLEMPYTPAVRGARIVPPGTSVNDGYRYRLGGATCLAGDSAGDYCFDEPLQPGDRVIFEDMMHYTMVKTNMFNGINLPDIGIRYEDGSYDLVRSFRYTDYRARLS